MNDFAPVSQSAICRHLFMKVKYKKQQGQQRFGTKFDKMICQNDPKHHPKYQKNAKTKSSKMVPKTIKKTLLPFCAPRGQQGFFSKMLPALEGNRFWRGSFIFIKGKVLPCPGGLISGPNFETRFMTTCRFKDDVKSNIKTNDKIQTSRCLSVI